MGAAAVVVSDHLLVIGGADMITGYLKPNAVAPHVFPASKRPYPCCCPMTVPHPRLACSRACSLCPRCCTIFNHAHTTRPFSPFGDVHALHLGTLQWSLLECTGAVPAPRYEMAAAPIPKSRSVVLFGGATHDNNFNDVHVLHIDDARWEIIETTGVPCVSDMHSSRELSLLRYSSCTNPACLCMYVRLSK